jgi:hypothetical protein
MSRFDAILTGAQSYSRNSLRLAFVALVLLWLWLIVLVSGYISWSVNALLLLALAIGFIGLERKTRIVPAVTRFLRNALRSREVVRLGNITRTAFLSIQRVPIHVALSLAYLLGMFGTALYLLLAMTN